MADDEPRNEIRTMDLNLYLGLPHRRPEHDLGSDLALASTILPPLFPEMSTSINNNNNNQSQSVSQPPPGEIVHNSLHDLEYNPYSPSYAQISPTPQPRLDEQQQQTLGIDHPPYLPAYVETSSSPTAQDSTEAVLLGGGSSSNNDIEYVPYPVPPYDPASSSSLPVETSELLQLQVQEGNIDNNAHAPYNPASPIIEVNISNDHSSSRAEVTGFCPYQDVQDGSGLQRVLLQCPEFRFRRLIEANRRLGGIRRFGSSTGVDSDLGILSPGPPPGFHDVRDPEGSVATNSLSQKGNVEGLAAEDLEEKETKERSSGAANFDCNVCLDVAEEPVVTSCGHLFCWPCLYQWLYLHSDHKECPVCKGEVIESNITPIFGRGSFEREVERKEDDGGQGDSSLKIPPRPRGRRVESLRQRFRRPLLRRLREEIGSWRFIIDDEMHRQVEGLEEHSVPPGFLDRRTLSRFMAARLHREDNLENGLNLGASGSSSNVSDMANGENLPDGLHGLGSRSIPPALARRGIDFWRRFASYSFPSDRLAAIAADLSNMVGRRANGSNNSGASASTSVNPPPDSDHANVQRPLEATVAADQASASSTIAVIQGDTGVPVDAPAELNSAGSSRVLRRRRRNATSGSLDVDGVHPASKRRRLN